MRKLVWILVAFLSLTVVSTAWAAGDSQPKSTGFFAFFRNLFSSSDSPSPEPTPPAQASGAGVQGHKKTKFIYLDDGSSDVNDRGTVLGSTSLRLHAGPMTFDHKDALTPNLLLERDTAGLNGLLTSPSAHNTQKTGSRLKLSIGSADRQKSSSDIDISLTSRATLNAPDAAGLGALSYNGALDQRAYTLGANVDYKGFYAGANYGRQQDGMVIGYHGYGLGLGYQGNKWSTGVQISSYHKDGDGLVGPDGVRVVQVGAAYAAGPWITFSGQFRYYDYNNRGARDLLVDQSHVFTLGTSLNF